MDTQYTLTLPGGFSLPVTLCVETYLFYESEPFAAEAEAAEAALSLLKPGGVLTICVYPGHEEGTRERGALLQWAGALDDGVYDAMAQEYLNIRKKPPLLIAVTKR